MSVTDYAQLNDKFCHFASKQIPCASKWSSNMEFSTLRRLRSSPLGVLCFCSMMKAWGRKVSRYSYQMLLVNFLLVLVSLFLFVMRLHVRMPPNEAYFSSPLTKAERAEMINLLSVFTKALDRQHILYFMASGTLIGSYRHHGPIPWDDDTDLYFLQKDHARVLQLITELGHQYRYFKGDFLSPVQKIYAVNGSRTYIHRPFTWPFVDLYFLDENKTHYENEELSDYPVPKEAVFPLVRRPFHNLWLPGPCNLSYLLKKYDLTDCYNRRYSHIMELPMAYWLQRYVPCERLYHLFPFTFRQTSRVKNQNVQVMREILKIDHWMLNNVSLRYPTVCDGMEGFFKG